MIDQGAEFTSEGFNGRVELMLIIIGEMVIWSLELLKRRCSRPGAHHPAGCTVFLAIRVTK
jgi:hypothetical protein